MLILHVLVHTYTYTQKKITGQTGEGSTWRPAHSIWPNSPVHSFLSTQLSATYFLPYPVLSFLRRPGDRRFNRWAAHAGRETAVMDVVADADRRNVSSSSRSKAAPATTQPSPPITATSDAHTSIPGITGPRPNPTATKDVPLGNLGRLTWTHSDTALCAPCNMLQRAASNSGMDANAQIVDALAPLTSRSWFWLCKSELGLDSNTNCPMVLSQKSIPGYVGHELQVGLEFLFFGTYILLLLVGQL